MGFLDKWRRNFKVVCIKEYYAGQGHSWGVGDVYTETFTKEEADRYCEAMNDSWEKNCWVVDPITEKEDA